MAHHDPDEGEAISRISRAIFDRSDKIPEEGRPGYKTSKSHQQQVTSWLPKLCAAILLFPDQSVVDKKMNQAEDDEDEDEAGDLGIEDDVFAQMCHAEEWDTVPIERDQDSRDEEDDEKDPSTSSGLGRLGAANWLGGGHDDDTVSEADVPLDLDSETQEEYLEHIDGRVSRVVKFFLEEGASYMPPNGKTKINRLLKLAQNHMEDVITEVLFTIPHQVRLLYDQSSPPSVHRLARHFLRPSSDQKLCGDYGLSTGTSGGNLADGSKWCLDTAPLL
ncbi:hypothetical protein BJX64DRAFT_288150 [Aspergillus heterothallicus]